MVYDSDDSREGGDETGESAGHSILISNILFKKENTMLQQSHSTANICLISALMNACVVRIRLLSVAGLWESQGLQQYLSRWRSFPLQGVPRSSPSRCDFQAFSASLSHQEKHFKSHHPACIPRREEKGGRVSSH